MVDRQSDVPVGTQLTAQLRSAVADGALEPGDRFPSIRDLAEATGVSVNTVRAVYARLEDEGLVRSEHGRGTFVADERGTRRELRRQIERLEGAVARGPQRGGASSGVPSGRLLTTAELRDVRDSLRAEVARLDAERGELMQRLAELERAGGRLGERRAGQGGVIPAVVDEPGQRAPALGRQLALGKALAAAPGQAGDFDHAGAVRDLPDHRGTGMERPQQVHRTGSRGGGHHAAEPTPQVEHLV